MYYNHSQKRMSISEGKQPHSSGKMASLLCVMVEILYLKEEFCTIDKCITDDRL